MTNETNRELEKKEQLARKMDDQDVLRSYRDRFHIPKYKGQDSIYLCGNSLGLQPKTAWSYVREELEDWASLGVEGHTEARHPWMPYHEFLTESMANIVGAKTNEVVVMNSLTVNLHLLMVSFYRPSQERYKIIIEEHAFPSDRYAVESQLKFHGFDPSTDLLVWRSPEGDDPLLNYEDLENLMQAHDGQVAMLLIGGVNYYSGQCFDCASIAEIGHRHGAMVGIDLAHGAGNVPLSLHDSNVDFAAWCSYKYLNSGPGGLSGIFVHERHGNNPDLPRFAGWWGHKSETRFQMPDTFDLMPGAEGWQLSNPPILPLAVLRASLDIFAEAGMSALRQKSIKLTGFLEDMIDGLNDPSIRIITPREPDQRGCQLSIRVENANKKLFEYITMQGVVADWREPDVIRVAPVPLYNTYSDVYKFVIILKNSILRLKNES